MPEYKSQTKLLHITAGMLLSTISEPSTILAVVIKMDITVELLDLIQPLGNGPYSEI